MSVPWRAFSHLASLFWHKSILHLICQRTEVRYTMPGLSRRKIGNQLEHVPSNTANLPPLCSANGLLHDLLASKCLDKIYCSLVAGRHGDNKADYVDPWWRWCANVGEGLQFLYGVSTIKIRLGIWNKLGPWSEKHLVETSKKS